MSNDLKFKLPARKKEIHKGLCGRLAIIAGSKTMCGAAILVAKAAFRSGVGLVYVLTCDSLVGVINAQLPECIVLPLSEKYGYIHRNGVQQVINYANKYNFNSIVVGPGLGNTDITRSFLKHLFLKKTFFEHVNLILDADALTQLSFKDFNSYKANSIVITPHPKEFRLFFKDIIGSFSQTQCQRLAAIESVRKVFFQVIVLKGYETIVAQSSKTYINDTGNSGMASAGTGDVLTGIIGGFNAQGLSLYDSAALGVFLHGKAGDLAYSKYHNGLMASDIIDFFPQALANLHNNE